MSPVRMLVAIVTVGSLATLTACQAVGSEPGASPSTIEVLARMDAQCPDSGARSQAGASPVATIYREAAQWRAESARSRELAGWRVDFASGETVLRVDAGAQPNPGWRLHVDAPRLDAGRQVLVLPVRVQPPEPGSFQAQVISFPCQYLRLAPARYRVVEIVFAPAVR